MQDAGRAGADVMRALVSGYYGFGNVGDEALLAAIAQELTALLPEAEIEVLSGDPEATRRSFGLEALDRWRLKAIRRGLRHASLLVQGGGGLIQDATSASSPAYYLGLLFLAWLTGVPYAVFCQGIGPLRSGLWRRVTAWLFDRARLVVVRDEPSAEALARWGLRRPAEVAADPAILLRPAGDEDVRQWLQSVGAALPEGYWLVVPRAVEPAASAVAEGARRLAEAGLPVAVLALQGADEPAARAMAEAAGGVFLPTPEDPAVAAAVVAGARAVLAVRLHALVFAAAAGTEALGVDYDPKVAALCDAVGYPHAPEPAADDIAAWAAGVQRGERTLRPESVERMRSAARHAFARLAEALRDAAIARRGRGR